MGLLKLLGLSSKHEGQHEHEGQHKAGKHAAGADKPKRLPKGKKK